MFAFALEIHINMEKSLHIQSTKRDLVYLGWGVQILDRWKVYHHLDYSINVNISPWSFPTQLKVV